MTSRRRQAAELAAAALGVIGALVLARRAQPRPRPTDAELLERLGRELRTGLEIPANTIELVVYGGVVELVGEVDTPELADELVERARAVPGVVRVENLLTLPEAPVR
jgi:osmotically-inducible protein OsmY